MDDYEILYKVWSGGIPIEFRLDKEEILAKSDVSYYVSRLLLYLRYDI